MNFKEACAYLDSLQLHKIKLGLEAMEHFLDKVSRPDKRLRFVHVAGTNGKGSVSVNITTVLARAGYRVGLFTSPHLSSVRERFRINESYISEKAFAWHASRVREVLGDEKITYFEFTTAIALLWFVESEVDLVVLETGLGGRLDATNVVRPLVSVITNISMDHEAYLGNDLKSIALEKAGIVKRDVPLVTAAADEISLEVIENRCRELGAPVYRYGQEFESTDYDDQGMWSWLSEDSGGKIEYTGLRCGMKGDYQISNSSLAIACLQLLRKNGFSFTGNDLRQGLLEVHWPGRLECLTLPKRFAEKAEVSQAEKNSQVRYLIDGAHNPAGVDSLLTTLTKEYSYEKLVVVWGAMEDKDLSLTVPAIAALASTVILTKPQGDRAADPDQLMKVIPKELRPRCEMIENVRQALSAAENYAQDGDLVVVAGSLYLIGEVRCLLVGELAK